MSMEVAIQPAALWTHFILHILHIFETKASFSNQYHVGLVTGSGLWDELALWLGVSISIRHNKDHGTKQFIILRLILSHHPILPLANQEDS